MQREVQQGQIATLALFGLMVVIGALGWSLRLAPQLHVDAESLGRFPMDIGLWHATEVPIDSSVESILRADFHIQRAYWSHADAPVWLYVGYYGTARGGRPEHTPRGCYTGAGWGIESSRTVEVDRSRDLRANEYVVEQSGERRLVHFWYRSHRTTGILGGLDQNVDRLLGRLFDGRADGALIRLSTPIRGDDTTAARSRLLALGSLVDPLLADHWPEEFACDAKEMETCRAQSMHLSVTRGALQRSESPA